MNTKAFLSKLNSVAAMARDGATAGERAAGRAAIGRLLERARAESELMRAAAGQQFLGEVAALAGINGLATTQFHRNASPANNHDVGWPGSDTPRDATNRTAAGAKRHGLLDMYL